MSNPPASLGAAVHPRRSTAPGRGLHLAMAVPCVIAALVLEGLALQLLLDAEQSTADVFRFLAFHLLGSIGIACVAHAVLPARYRRAPLAGIGLLTSFAFFIPFLGILAVMIGALTAPRAAPALPFASVRPPEFAAPSQDREGKLRATGTRSLLLDPSLPEALRMRSLTALQNLPMRRAQPLLSRLLGDPADDMRLSAYGLLDRETRRVSATIEADLAVLEAVGDGPERARALRRVAEHYWELVYAGLARADLADFAVEAGLRHADAALAFDPADPGLHLVRGRLLGTAGDLDAAVAAYEEAIRAGAATERVAPYLAEIAFVRRDYNAVARHMRTAGHAGAHPGVVPLIRFWA